METSTAQGRKTVIAGAVTLLGAWMGVAAGGCGGVSGIPVDDTATRIANTVCPKAYVCCTPDELGMNAEAGTDVASCESMTKSNYQNVLATLQASVDQKRAVYVSSQAGHLPGEHPEHATAATLNTTNHLTGVPGCDSFTTPLVIVGGACSQDYECISGWCNVPSTSTNGDGTCAAFLGPGQDCASRAGPAADRRRSATRLRTSCASRSRTSTVRAPTTSSARASTAAPAAAAA